MGCNYEQVHGGVSEGKWRIKVCPRIFIKSN
jgi:hypothetical protein